ncbi:deoxyribose-phosphate aldolase [Sporanaerobium hydrogeniformans]|uniref:Deoxyribose-phosphate aldolase n=1 Tax=Sporanaerobium hydrogeniformans TaxID=3072179 RepID=A0AC61DCD9_9FIRM|nr:deoxyribose-phosphate aldolase [Sporanaerobium hydrogeniformans]PHV70974.1 deoxyribose-phosphate aldolase [Sporanaerobium hydrogeniformans]
MNIAQMIDHTCLKATATEADIKQLCEEAITHNFKTVCVPTCYVAMSAHLLSGTDVGITTVVGFPLGNETPAAKAFEAKEAVLNGATDVDMVINIGALKDKKYDYVKFDIEEVVRATKSVDPKALVKVIIETCYLTPEEIEEVTEIVVQAGADFVKTSTGFGTAGATLENIQLMKKIVGNRIEIKAAGGIGSSEDAKLLIEAGATRLGTSKSIAIIQGEKLGDSGAY